MSLTSTIFACAVVIGGAAAGPLAAHAAPRSATVNVVVSTKGLDPATENGARRLLHRLARGASKACGGVQSSSPLEPHAYEDFRRCRAEALADVVARSNMPKLQRQFAATRDAARVRLAAR